MINAFLKSYSIGLAIACLTVIGGCNRESMPDEPVEGLPIGNSSKLEEVLDRKEIICGVNGQLPGFSFIDETGNYAGIDVDFCRAVAAALFDDPKAVQFKELSAQERLEVVQNEGVDLLSRNTTWTISRDTVVGLEFGPILFYDGQGILVSQASGVQAIADLEGKSICVQSGTTTELNLADRMRQKNITYKPVVFDDAEDMYQAYADGRCEGATSDRSQLVIRRATMADPEAHKLLSDVLSKEPLAPVVKNDDSPWFDTVKWVAYALIQAEEFGINSDNVSDFLDSKDPLVRRFLGLEGRLGEDMGLSNDFALRIIKHVGNYGEIYERNLGEPFGLERGMNSLWTDDGLIYSPPFR
ncbi:extracellular solute-binding protein family 3 [[Leptolyngbya] sp. PCC 7376]|uniref:amino acid ABC transporter substrate-binding protein n=1 Tax=[Leptolyngbya] sp. PCC 7376 TaxID=111781 RepID=UPI00029F3F32|nr:amino acid ABC transporter substrate-binding protein [[Leptolyngbya] sp. PCC 7376]AFY37251.1 extracellular solute-binding protein family 3 [[Leptolyngbya] sp. PCC 7376]